MHLTSHANISNSCTGVDTVLGTGRPGRTADTERLGHRSCNTAIGPCCTRAARGSQPFLLFGLLIFAFPLFAIGVIVGCIV